MEWTRKQISILIIVAITAFMGTFLISSVNVALPAMGKTFNLNAVSLSWLITSFLLATAMLMLPVGRWGDLTGVRRLFKIGIVFYTLSSLVCGFIYSGILMIIFRFIQGVGASFTMTTGSAILVASFPPKFRGRVLGFSVSSVYLGLAFGPFVGGILTQYLGWRSIFYVATALGVISSVIAFIFLGNDEDLEVTGEKLDLKGSLFYMTGLVAMVYGSSKIPALLGWLLMAGGLVALIVFWLLENRSAMPVLDTGLFTKNRLFAYSNIAALINYSATYAIVFLLSLFLQKVKGLNPRDAGIILVAQPIMMAIFSPIMGRMSDRVQPRYLATIGMTMCTLGLVAFAFISESTPIAFIVSILIWEGLGFAFFSSPNMNTIMSSVERNQLGLASGISSTMRVVGQIVSMTIVTLFFAAFLGQKVMESVDKLTFVSVIHWGFITFAIIGLSGIYFSYSRGKMER